MAPFDFSADKYVSPNSPVSWFARCFPSLVFFTSFLGVVYSAATLAKRGKYDGQAWARSSWDVFRALERAGVRFEISGIQNLVQLQSPCVLIGNHMSTMETVVLPGIVRPNRDVTFVVKTSLLSVPVFKHVIRSRDPIVVGRTDPRMDLKSMIEGGIQRLENGVSVIIFPQGERTPVFDPKEFNSIGVKLAVRAKVPVLPVALKTDAWGIGKIVSDFGRIDPTRTVRISFGKPLDVQGRGAEEQKAIVEFIGEKLKSWQDPDKLANT